MKMWHLRKVFKETRELVTQIFSARGEGGQAEMKKSASTHVS